MAEGHRSCGVALGGSSIRDAALRIADFLHIPDFQASKSWLAKFRYRKRLSIAGLQEEVGQPPSRDGIEADELKRCV